MRIKLNVIDSTLNEVGKKFDYHKKEILFDRFKGWFDGIEFTLDNDKFMGWGRYISGDGSLIIGTACFDGGEWLNTVQHRHKANNPYNNFVNAIAYWDVLNENGRKFFLEFYKEDFFMLKYKLNSQISEAQAKITRLQKEILDIDTEIDSLTL